MFPRRRLENVDKDLDFDIKTQIGQELKAEWLKCKSAADESPHLQSIMEMLHRATCIPSSEDVPWHEAAPAFPQIPSETCTKLMEKWVQFKLTEFKGFWRVIPETANESFKMPENQNFNILFSVLPGILQHPSQKVESASSNVAEQVIFLLKAISIKYCNVIVGWPKDHPQYAQLSHFTTAAFVSFSRASYFFAIPLKNCIEATGANVNVFSPTLEYTQMKFGLQTLKDHSSCSVEVCHINEGKKTNIPFHSICAVLQQLRACVEYHGHSHLTEDQFRVQDTCYELLFRIAAFGLDKKVAVQYVDQLSTNGIFEASILWPHTFLPVHRRQHKRQIPNATTVKWTCSHLIKSLHLLKLTVHSLGQLGLLQDRDILQKLFDPRKEATSSFLSSSLLLNQGITNAILWMYSAVPVPSTVPDSTSGAQANDMETQASEAIKSFAREVKLKMSPDDPTNLALSIFGLDDDISVINKVELSGLSPQIDAFSCSFNTVSLPLDPSNSIEQFLLVIIGLIKATSSSQGPSAPASDSYTQDIRVKLVDSVVNIFDEKSEENQSHGTGEEIKSPEHTAKVRRSLLETCSSLQFSALKFFAHLSVLTQGCVHPPVSEIIRKSSFMSFIFGQAIMGSPECRYFFKHPSSQAQIDPTSLQCQYIRALRQCVVNFLADIPSIGDSSFTELLLLRNQLLSFIASKDVFSVEMILSAVHSINIKHDPKVAGEKFHKMGLHLEVPKLLLQINSIMENIRAESSRQSELDDWERVFLLFCVVMHKSLNAYPCRHAMLLPANLRSWLDLMYSPRLRFFASIQIREAIELVLSVEFQPPFEDLKMALAVIFQNFTTYHDPQVGPLLSTQNDKGTFIIGLLHLTYCLCTQLNQPKHKSAKNYLQELLIQSDVFTHLSSLLHLPEGRRSGDEFLAACVVRCIGVIMHASEQGKKAFTLYGEFSELLWSWCGHSSKAYLVKDALKYMAFDPVKPNRITNGDVVKLMIDLSRLFTDENALMYQYSIIQETADNTLLRDDVRDVISASECCAVGLLSSLIEWLSAIAIHEEEALQSGSVGSPDMLQAYVIRVVKILGAHKIKVKDLKDWFRLLRPRQSTRPALFKELLKNLISMVETSVDIVSFFVFDGRDAGLVFPPVTDKENRSGTGSSMCFWLQFSVADMEEFCVERAPHVLAHIWNKKGEVLLVVFDEQNIKVLFRDKDQEWTTTQLRLAPSFKWTPDTWHFVCVAFTPSQGGFMSRKPNLVEIFLNKSKVSFAHSSNSKMFDFANFQGVVANVADHLVDYQPPDPLRFPFGRDFDEFKAFNGRIAGFSFMDKALTEESIREYGDIESLMNASSKLSSCLFSINPRACVVGSSDLNSSGQQKEYANVGFSPPDSQLSNAVVVGKSIPVVSTSAKQMLECVGGVRAIFPLLEVIEKGDADASLASMVIEFLVSVCNDCKLNVRSFLEAQGFEILHLRLRKLKPYFKTPDLFQSIKKLLSTVFVSMLEKQEEEQVQALLRYAKIVEFPSERPENSEKFRRDRDENKFFATLLMFDPQIWVHSSPKCFKMVLMHLINESFNGFSSDQKFFHRTPLALTLRIACRFLSTSSIHRSIISFKIDEKIDPVSIEYLKHISDSSSAEYNEKFTVETIQEYRTYIFGKFCEKICRKSRSNLVYLLESDWRLLVSFIVSTEEPALLNDLVSLLCNLTFQLHAKNEDIMFDWLNSLPLSVDQNPNMLKFATYRKPDVPKTDVIAVLTIQMFRVNEQCRCLITQLLILWYSKMDLPKFQKYAKTKKTIFSSMLFAVMSRLESPPPSLSDIVTLICGATNVFESMRMTSKIPLTASEPTTMGSDSLHRLVREDGGSGSSDSKDRRSQLSFSIQDINDFIIPRMLQFSTEPTFSCDLESTFQLFQPVLLLLRFLPNNDFSSVVEILRQVFLTISNEKKLAVVTSILRTRSSESSRAGQIEGKTVLEGNLLIWFTKAILNARCNPGNQDDDIDKLREILCNFFLVAIEECPSGHRFLEECVYIIHQDIAVSSAIRDSEARRLIMWLCLQVRTKVAMKAAENKFETSWGKQTDFVKNLCKLLEFLGNYFFHLSSALSPDTYEKCTARLPEVARDPESDVFAWLAGNRNATMNFCRAVSNEPLAVFEWKDCDLASCAMEISATLIFEYLRGVREMYKRPVNGHPHTKETHDEFSKLIFTADIENHIAIALKVGLQILKVFILDSLVKGHSESFSKHVSQFTLLVSEAHGGTCPEKKCGADISLKMNAKYTSYDPFVLECVAFIHQQVLACDRYLQMAPEDSTREYRSAMIQCRSTCLQSLHQLVQRSIANIKIAAPDLKLDLHSSLMSDEDDPRTLPEMLFDEYCAPSSLFYKASLRMFWPLSSKDIEAYQDVCASFKTSVNVLFRDLNDEIYQNYVWSLMDSRTERDSEVLMQEFVGFWRFIDKEKKHLRIKCQKAEQISSDIVENERNVWAKKDDGANILEIVPMEFPRCDVFRSGEGQYRMRMKLCKKKLQCRHVAASRRLHDEVPEQVESPQLKPLIAAPQMAAADALLEDAAEDDDADAVGQQQHQLKETKFENVWQLFPAGDPVQGTINVTKESITFIPKNELQKWQRTWRSKCACQIQWDQAAGNEWVLAKGQHPIMCHADTEKPAHWYDMNRPKNNPKKRSWQFADIREVYKRRYNFRPESIEIYLASGKTVLLRFENGLKDVKDMLNICKKAISEGSFVESNTSKRNRRRDELVLLWQSHKITNFEYLMQLNVLAGRTYQDLEQYPVFPWILADYGSENLDLSKNATFRDLSKPMGALNERRREEGVKNYIRKKEMHDEMCAEEDTNEVLKQQSQATVCMWKAGFYSTAAYVLRYLIRVEPFTTFHIDYQSGRFDHTDRNFYSVINDWQNSSGLDAFGQPPPGQVNFADDYRELIPEFFYLPEMFTNDNGFDLGELPGKVSISNVKLPPWARNSPDLFVKKHREALESQHVSDHLHEWIDLIFGCNQPYESPNAPNTPNPNTLAAFNLFSPVCYKRSSDTVSAFGVVPTQLWTVPSPRRRPVTSDPISVVSKKVKCLGSIQPIYIGPTDGRKSVCFIATMANDQMYTISQDRKLLLHNWIPGDQTLRLELDSVKSKSFRRIGTAFAVSDPGQHLFAVANFSKSQHLVYSCGYWDNSVVCSSLSDGNTIASSMDYHKDVCTCIAVDTQSYRYLVTGSADTTVLVWEIGNGSPANKFGLKEPKHTLYGHDNKVTCVAINCAMNMIVSGSSDGTLMIHDIRGRYVRSVYIPDKGCVKSFVVSQLGSIFVLSGAASSDAASCMHHYSPNGRRIHSDATAGDGVNCMLLFTHPTLPFEHRELLIQGRRSGMVVLSTTDFKKLWPRPADPKVFKNPVISLATSQDGKRVLAGTADGQLQWQPILEIMLEILDNSPVSASEAWSHAAP